MIITDFANNGSNKVASGELVKDPCKEEEDNESDSSNIDMMPVRQVPNREIAIIKKQSGLAGKSTECETSCEKSCEDYESRKLVRDANKEDEDEENVSDNSDTNIMPVSQLPNCEVTKSKKQSAAKSKECEMRSVKSITNYAKNDSTNAASSELVSDVNKEDDEESESHSSNTNMMPVRQVPNCEVAQTKQQSGSAGKFKETSCVKSSKDYAKNGSTKAFAKLPKASTMECIFNNDNNECSNSEGEDTN